MAERALGATSAESMMLREKASPVREPAPPDLFEPHHGAPHATLLMVGMGTYRFQQARPVEVVVPGDREGGEQAIVCLRRPVPARGRSRVMLPS